MDKDMKPTSSPPATTFYQVGFPAPWVMLVTINREARMNAIPIAGHREGHKLWQWFDEEPGLRVAVVTGKGARAFCCGADLKELEEGTQSGEKPESVLFSHGGFMGFSRREGKKPVIAAVNGFAFGGGFEIVLNCDMVMVSPTAQFSFPEVKRGLWPAAGGTARLARTFGMQLASEIVLTGRVLSAMDAMSLGFARVSRTPDSLLAEAIELAKEVASMSPDAVIVARAGLRQTWETASVERATQLTENRYDRALMKGENLRIGLKAFVNKQKPEWVPAKL
ncbi:hypothetical protein CDD80_7175 [Ophiocordyceps camponoti-rufipedis]|uniref:Enoyl-CoA hydratase n=1 Tax=Ophiocordyceps camponoti-rufipedis TaxID=2004952 RepID=A0A2C5ZG96_9HYPO|nr:hypothetical protein CDD80_7175 [Ophiocordyceps camponoti-rufipedis]